MIAEIRMRMLQEAKRLNAQAIREFMALNPDAPQTLSMAFAIADGIARGLAVSSETYSAYRIQAERDGLNAEAELSKAETKVEDLKKKRIFNHYKQDLIKLHRDCRQLRMLTIEYVCRAPNIDPFIMAKELVKEGYNVVFDDTSITLKENERKRRKVYGK